MKKFLIYRKENYKWLITKYRITSGLTKNWHPPRPFVNSRTRIPERNLRGCLLIKCQSVSGRQVRRRLQTVPSALLRQAYSHSGTCTLTIQADSLLHTPCNTDYTLFQSQIRYLHSKLDYNPVTVFSEYLEHFTYWRVS